MSKQYDMAATGWEEFPGPAWEKGKWGIGQIEATGQWGLGVKGEPSWVATMANDSIDPVGSLARIADEREGKAKEPVSLNEDRERKARETKRTSEERSAAALESIAASLAKIADQPSGIPMTAEDARARLGMKKPEHPVNIAPEGEPPIFRKPGEPAPAEMTILEAVEWANSVEADWKAGKIARTVADAVRPPTPGMPSDE